MRGYDHNIAVTDGASRMLAPLLRSCMVTNGGAPRSATARFARPAPPPNSGHEEAAAANGRFLAEEERNVRRVQR